MILPESKDREIVREHGLPVGTVAIMRGMNICIVLVVEKHDYIYKPPLLDAVVVYYYVKPLFGFEFDGVSTYSYKEYKDWIVLS